MTLKSLLNLRSDEAGAFDGSVAALSVRPFRNVRALDSEGRFRIDSGFIEVGRNRELDSLGSFTLEASLTPDKIDGGRQNIMEAKTPAVAFFIEAGGVLVGSIHTAAGWKSVTSGSVRLQARVKSHVRFTRDARGRMALEINGRPVGAASVPGAIVPVGPTGFRIGTWTDGRGYQFVGEIADVQIRSGAAPAALWTQKAQTAKRLETRFKALFELGAVTVELNPDASYARLQPIKDIMNAAGVAKISDLSTLKITRPTVMTPGKVMVAARKQQAAADVNWGKVAQSIVLANPQEKRAMLARYMTNRNSTKVLSGLKVAAAPAGVAAAQPPRAGVIGSGGRIPSLGDAGRTSTRLPVEVMRVSPTLRLAEKPKPTADFVKIEGNQLKLADAAAISRLELKQPGNWPALSAMTPQLMSLKTIPVNSAVMIAGTLDLTNTELVVAPAVETFYIIAEKIVCGANAKITWRRPGGSTPPRADDPGLDGRGYAGVHTKRDSRDGLDGEDGRGGGPGVNGAGGIHAPHLEVWVKDLSGMPNLDLNGEDGIKGGRGQRGGRGGNGANGHVGKRVWVFKWICTKRPGDGGSGGDGGDGGRGGRGGNGGDGGNITIGVLDGTLETAVTSRAFKIKNQGGQKGRGGDGGEGGRGGRGGRSGRGETCKDAKDGANGAAGQRGRPGPDGASMGDDGEVQFFEFSEQAWEELLTRPWISELSPERIFPGDRLTIRGSRFSSRDRVMVGALSLVPGINADESISVAIPPNIAGGLHVVYILRSDGTQSNRLRLRVRPRLDAFTSPLTPGSEIVLSGSAFLNGATVLVAGQAVPADVQSPSRLSFKMPDTGGSGSAGGRVALQVNNPDGMVSNSREGTIPRILEVPFTFGVHNLSFGNFTDGVPDWGTYEDTFGAAEIWHELLDPIFGHPILTSAFYGFYHYFLKGEARGGLATGFCTSLASLVADKFWLGETDTHGITKASVHKMLTAIHGRLLSRESLIHFHDQSREGVSRVEKTYREIEATFLRGCDRHNAPLLFFIPSGAVWDSGYFDKLGSSHCIMPIKFAYPAGHPGPRLSVDGTTTTTDPNGVALHCWDCNHPASPNCRLVFQRRGGQIHYDYFADSTTAQFSSAAGITLGMMSNGAYKLSDHDLPFSGPLGLTRFIVDFLLSPAELQVTDDTGLRTGCFGSQILAEIPDSHPAYLVKGALLLPADRAMTRKIVGTRAGRYSFSSIAPNQASLSLEGVATQSGHEDLLAVNADYSQIRFSPCVEKKCSLTLGRMVGDQARALSVEGIGGGALTEIDITASPELSLVRIGNRSSLKTVAVKAFSINQATNTPVNRERKDIRVPKNHDLVVAVSDWDRLDLNTEAVSF